MMRWVVFRDAEFRNYGLATLPKTRTPEISSHN